MIANKPQHTVGANLAVLRELLALASIRAHELPDATISDNMCDTLERLITDCQVLLTQHRAGKFPPKS